MNHKKTVLVRLEAELAERIGLIAISEDRTLRSVLSRVVRRGLKGEK